MNKVVALKDWEVFETKRLAKCLQNEPALVIDFLEKRSEKIQKQILQLWVRDGLQAMRAMISDYEILMQELAQRISPEQLAEITPLSAEDQIREDLRRLNDLVDGLEAKVNEKSGVTLIDALQFLKKHGSAENAMVIEYLENNNYPVFVALMKICEFTSVGGDDAALEAQITMIADILGQMGVVASVNALNQLNANLRVALSFLKINKLKKEVI